METHADPFADPDLADELGAVPAGVLPPVVAVVVTRNAGPWFERALASLGAQDYPSLTTLVLDARSDADPTQRVADSLPNAFVRRLDDDGFGAAANEAIATVEGASYLLLCHDDVELDPDAVRLLVEEAFRSNAGIAGPKLVDADRPDVLLEVGMSIDRFGVPHSGIEAGEVDQEQHDGVRDVFYVSSAAMLVRADLFRELGGFDPDAFPGAEDLDLCWRARLLGARVLVVPDARVRHHVAAGTREGIAATNVALVQRNRVRALLTCYSRWTLARVLPLAWLLAVAEAIGFLVTRQRARIKPVLGAWFGWRSTSRTVRERRRAVQESRVVDDADLRFLQTRGSARLKSFFSGHLRLEERIEQFGQARAERAERATRGRTPLVAVLGVLVVAFVIGARGLVTSHVSEVGSFMKFESIGTLFSTFTAAWRPTGLGSPVAASPLFAGLGVLSTALFGAVDLALTVVVVGAIPVGGLGAYWLVRRALGRGLTPLLAGVLYAISPLFRNAIADGRLGALVFAAGLPWFLTVVVGAAGWGRADGGPQRPASARRRSIVGAGVVLAVMVAAYPSTLILAFVLAVAVLAAVPFVGERALATAAVRTIAGSILIAIALCGVWLATTFVAGVDRESWGAVFSGSLDLGAVLRFETGPSGAGVTGWFLVAAAAGALLVATGVRWRWAARGSILAAFGFGLAWLPGQLDLPYAAVEGPLAIAALGLAIAAATAVATLRDDLTRSRFGWRHIVTIVALVALVGPALGFVGDSGSGRYGQPETDWASTMQWMDGDTRAGEFRVLWIGDASVLPVDPVAEVGAVDVDWALTRNGPDGVATLLPAPAGDAEFGLSASLAAAADGHTNRLGRLLAPAGVRYVALVERPAPEAGRSVGVPADVTQGLRGQLDFAELEAPAGMRLFENRAWIPTRAVITGDAPASVDDPVELAAAALTATPAPAGEPVAVGTVTWAEAYDPAWVADAAGARLEHRETFGWANGYELPAAAPVEITYSREWIGTLLALLQAALWIVAIGFAAGARRPRWSRRRTGDAASDPDGEADPDPDLDGAVDAPIVDATTDAGPR